jgi:hypothetical protein
MAKSEITVTVDPADVARLLARVAELEQRDEAADARLAQYRSYIERLEAALRQIEGWRDFPDSGHKWPDGRPIKYSTAFGSNGERDYMRSVARRALSGAAQPRGEDE